MKKQTKKNKYPRTVSPEEIAARKERERVSEIIESTCETFACPVDVIGHRAGPIVTEYKVRPLRFTRIKNLRSLNEDLAVAVPAENVSVSRVPGEKALSICIPNPIRQEIEYEPTLEAIVKHREDMILPLNLGVSPVGEPIVVDLTKAGPHMLIAGSTGAGKSVAINTILTSLLYIRSPKELELILIDPKQVELMPYAGLPHVKRQPVSGIFESLALMETVIQEMRRRMAFISGSNCKNLAELNVKLKAQKEQTMTYIVMVIDEMGELAITQKKLFTERMASITQMARASGIHLIAATQRPSVDVLSGKIKVNFGARLSLRVPSSGDSKTVLGRGGAEQLLGRGDAFLISNDTVGMIRCHLPHCKETDIKKMLQLSSQLGHVNNVPADGLPGGSLEKEAKELKEETKPVEPKKTEEIPGISYTLRLFLDEKKLTLDEVKKWPGSKQQELNSEYKKWQHNRRQNRRGM